MSGEDARGLFASRTTRWLPTRPHEWDLEIDSRTKVVKEFQILNFKRTYSIQILIFKFWFTFSSNISAMSKFWGMTMYQRKKKLPADVMLICLCIIACMSDLSGSTCRQLLTLVRELYPQLANNSIKWNILPRALTTWKDCWEFQFSM